MKKSFFVCLLILVIKLSFSQTISPDSAIYFVGKIVTVKGQVMSTFRSYSHTDKKKIVLYLGKPYPDETFSVVIFEEYFAEFGGEPDKILKDKVIHIRGKITSFKNKPQLIVNSFKQIEYE